MTTESPIKIPVYFQSINHVTIATVSLISFLCTILINTNQRSVFIFQISVLAFTIEYVICFYDFSVNMNYFTRNDFGLYFGKTGQENYINLGINQFNVRLKKGIVVI